MQPSNEADIIHFLHEAKAYIFSLKESRDGKHILNSSRKTGFLGFVVCIDSLLRLCCHCISIWFLLVDLECVFGVRLNVARII